jgi:hypothetical protein
MAELLKHWDQRKLPSQDEVERGKPLDPQAF